MYETAIFVCAIVAGATAAVSGFGIGSLLTPLLALHAGTKTAVAAVSIPHLIGTAIRFWRLRASLDRPLLWRFGLTSAAGGLAGALLNAQAPSPALTMVLGSLLVLAGGVQITGSAQRWRFHGSVAWIAGAMSGLFGGLVGNQGGIRSAAMLGFDLPKERFVATATAIALFVDAARMPVYLVARAVRGGGDLAARPDRDGRRDRRDAQRRAAPGEGAGTAVQAGGGSDYPVAGDRDSAAPKRVRRPKEDRWPG